MVTAVLRALLLALACAWLSATPRALWVWEPEALRLMDDPGYADRILALLKRHGFTTLYLYADAYRGRNPVLDEPERCRALLARIHRAGMKAEALLGSYPLKTWEYVLPEHDQPARAMVQRVLRFNAGGPPEGRFDGLHLDIEPYALDAWSPATREAISRQYLERSREWVGLARSASPALPIGAAIPFWYDGFEVTWQGVRRPMNAHVQDLYDYVAIMDYRNQAEGSDGIITHALQELAHADATGRGVVIGLELGDTEPAKLTFRGLGPGALARESAKAAQRFSASPSFRGFAFHHLRTWLELMGVDPSDPGGR